MSNQTYPIAKSILATILTAAVCAVITSQLLPKPASGLQRVDRERAHDSSDATSSLSKLSKTASPTPTVQETAIVSAASNDAEQNQFAQTEFAQTLSANQSGPERAYQRAEHDELTQTTANQQFSDEERYVFASLPPICTSNLPTSTHAGPESATTVPNPYQAKSGLAEQNPPTQIPTSDRSVQNDAVVAQNNPNDFQNVIRHPVVEKSYEELATLDVANPSFFETERSAHHSQLNSSQAAQAHSFHGRLRNDTSADSHQANPDVQQASYHSADPNTAATAEVAFNASSASTLSSGSTFFDNQNPQSDASDEDPHLELYSRDPFPSAKQCAQCHKQIYEEWASSSHAYASISPMFHVFEETINKLSQGTIGYFCYRCHSPVSTAMGLRRDQPIWDGPRVFREGVTCVACHRVKIPYGKTDGERRIEPGDIYAPVYGSGDGRGVSIADKYSEYFKVKTDRSSPKKPGQPLHRRAIQFEELSKSSFCMSCHQVAVEPGIKLEVVWDQYRASPAYRQGISCQDCHMGRVPGLDEGYSVGPGAIVNDRVINAEKKHSNHVFYGPGYSIAHPGVFPDNLEADRWTVPQWLEFDWRAGWGTDAFEDAIAQGKMDWHFPPTWSEVDDRYDAREIIDANLAKLEYKRDLRRQLLENGSKLDGPFFNEAPAIGQPLKFRFCLTNLNSGHNMPSGSLGAQPQLWMNVVLIDPNGNRVWESGYLDSNGDLADNHSLDVLARKVPLDTQLFNLQTKFLTTNVKGTDREMYLPVNFDIDQIPFLRPPQQPVSVINHPPFIRMEAHSIPPLGKRNAKFAVPSRLLQTRGTYRLTVRMRSRAEPIYFMRFCNATPEMQRMMNEWICDFHINTVTFEVH
ncbi:MAG: multiheme c-type cytochrome [Planctomycetota bacterium]